MDNMEILREIEKKITTYKEKKNTDDNEKINAIISDIENLIKKYKPENDIQERILQNRTSEVNNMRNCNQAVKVKKRKVRSKAVK